MLTWLTMITNTKQIKRFPASHAFKVCTCGHARSDMCDWIQEYMLSLLSSRHQHAYPHSELMMLKAHPTISRPTTPQLVMGEPALQPQYRGLFIRMPPSQHTDYLSD